MLTAYIIPGSFKPPHKGHLSLLEKIIKKSVEKKENIGKIVILISRKVRPFDNRFSYLEQKTKEELQNALKDYYPESDYESFMNLKKPQLLLYIKELMASGFLKSVSPDQSLKIWKIYIKYLNEIYSLATKKPKIEVRISTQNNIMLETDKIILELFKEKYKRIVLLKSAKNASNSRFDFIEKKYKRYIETKLFPDIKNIEATGMRAALLNKNREFFIKYLPKDLDKKTSERIYKLLLK